MSTHSAGLMAALKGLTLVKVKLFISVLLLACVKGLLRGLTGPLLTLPALIGALPDMFASELQERELVRMREAAARADAAWAKLREDSK